MNCIIKRPFEPIGRIRDIDNTLEALQKAVGGYIEVVPIGDGIVMICNENGKFNNSHRNFKIPHDIVFGTVIVVGVDGEEFTDVPIDLGEWLELLVEWGNTL